MKISNESKKTIAIVVVIIILTILVPFIMIPILLVWLGWFSRGNKTEMRDAAKGYMAKCPRVKVVFPTTEAEAKKTMDEEMNKRDK